MRNPIYSLSTRQIKSLQEAAKNLGGGGVFHQLLPRYTATSQQHRQQVLSLYRGLHRQTTRFFDEYTRRYLSQRIWKKFLTKRNLDMNGGKRNSNRIAILLEQGWKAHRLLVAANDGYLNAVNKVLDLAYGRRGHKKHSLLNHILEYREPGELSQQELDESGVIPAKIFKDRHYKRFPHFSSPLNELAVVERKLDITGKKINPEWGSKYLKRPFQTGYNDDDERAFKIPLEYKQPNRTKAKGAAIEDPYVKLSRVANIHWKEYNITKSSIFPPLPKHTVSRLESFVKHGKVDERVRMRARQEESKKKQQQDDDTVLGVLKKASKPCIRSNINKVEKAPRRNRFYRRSMLRILCKTVTIQRDYDKGKWNVEMSQLSTGVPISTGKPRQFEGVDGFGNVIN